MDYEKKYKEALEKARQLCVYPTTKPFISDLQDLFPELKESEDEKIRKGIKSILEHYKESGEVVCPYPFVSIDEALVWLEKQNKQKNKINSCKITFEDVLALECAMKTVKITKGCDELYKILVPLYDKIHNAYLIEKQGGQKQDFTLQKDIPRYSIGDVLCDKSCTMLNKELQSNFKITDIRNGLYICDKCSFPISQQDEYELVAKRIESTWSEKDEENFRDIVGAIHAVAYQTTEDEESRLEWLYDIKQRMGG